ncbi:hypothetical protein HKCCE2091_05825 [Rhodobacterales bacterium HKCCE2091]|nr:hypothetical protein [Rhodobacterales bacterium HKCCE2091]
MSVDPTIARFLDPQTIAVVGASDRAGSLGLRTMRNLDGFTGRVYPVSRRLDRIGDRPCFATLADLPEPPDCVILAVPAAAVEDEVRAAAAAGAGGAVVFASGYAELSDPAGRMAQDRLAAVARESGMRLLGPNTTGFATFASGARAGFAEFPGGVPEGRRGIAIVSQSGAMGLGLAQAAEHGVAISHVLTCGNSSDLDAADLVAFAAGQPAATSIALAFEGISEPDRLLSAIRDAGKPVAVLRAGRSPAGAEAVRRHTGTDPHAGFDWNGGLAQAGAITVVRPERLVETAVFLAKSAELPPRAGQPRIAILTSSGGNGILAADAVAAAGLPLAALSPATTRALAARLPAFGAAHNPCDATAEASSDPNLVPDCAGAILSDPAVDALLLPWGKAWDAGQFGTLSDLARRHGKPLCLVWMSQWSEGPGAAEAEAQPGLSVFRSLDACCAALSRR